jgi:hypothetical protein
VHGDCHGEFGVVFGRSSVNCCSSVIVWMWSLNTSGVLVKWGCGPNWLVSGLYDV